MSEDIKYGDAVEVTFRAKAVVTLAGGDRVQVVIPGTMFTEWWIELEDVRKLGQGHKDTRALAYELELYERRKVEEK